MGAGLEAGPGGRPAAGLTCDAVLALALRLRRLHVDALVPDEASAGDASVGLAEALLM